MSSRRWSTRLERIRLQQLLDLTTVLINKEEEEDEASSDGGNSSSSSLLGDEAIRITLLYYAFINMPRYESQAITFGRRLLIADFDDATCVNNFHFRKAHLQYLSDLLWPRLAPHLNGQKDSIEVKNRYKIPFETGLLLVLYRLSRPHTIYFDIEAFFGMRKSHISAVVQTFVDSLYLFAFRFLNNPAIYKPRMPDYAAMIKTKIGIVDNVWGFIDGTLRKICRPTYHQRLLYSGHKRTHGIKFQSVIAPDGLIVDLFGPIEGSRHDSYMLGQSNLLPKLRALMPADGSLGPVYSLYGDPAYPQSLHLFGGFRNPLPGSPEAQWNTLMSQVRQVVEWGFKEITAQWAFLDNRPRMRIMKSPIGKYYVIACFLVNLRNCFYGGQIAAYFDAMPLSVDDYLELVVDD
jgi:nuclease HARBI1